MRRNAISIGILTLLLSTGGMYWWATPSVANDVPPATAEHTAAVHRVASVLKRRRIRLAASLIPPAPKPTPAASTSTLTYLSVVDQPTITENHKKLATAVLNALPSCRDHLKNFSILYSGATRRGLGGKTTIILDGSVSDSEFVALLVHECGHVIHGNLLGTTKATPSTFKDGGDIFWNDSPMVAFWKVSWTNATTKNANAKDADFVSGYAKSDVFEEFSETFTAYVLQRDMLQERAKTNAAIAAKLAWFESNLPMPEDTLGDGIATWTGTVPWDITKLAYTLTSR